MVGNVLSSSRCEKLCFEETELRLGIGLPGVGDQRSSANYGKRGFCDTVDLKLKLSIEETGVNLGRDDLEKKDLMSSPTDSVKPPSKSQMVGWPPVRSFRKSAMAAHQKSHPEDAADKGNTAAFVKVSMDGAPYLRKVDLKVYNTYQELYDSLGKMFTSFSIGKCESETRQMMELTEEGKVMDLLNRSDYVPTYEDRDGDWMLVGDVPWEMFVGSCKRLRIMKGAEAKGLAPRATEKCKSRS